MKYVENVRKRFVKRPAFSLQDLRLFLKKSGASKEYVKQLVHSLLVGRELKHLTRGVYSFHDDVQLIGYGFQPYYYGLQDALSIHDLWEQETNPVVITPRKVRNGLRKFGESNYLVRRISRKMFYGFKPVHYGEYWINVSDAEKTFIDFVYFKEHLSSEVLKELRKKVSEKKLRQYLVRCSPRVKKRVLKLFKGWERK